MDQMTTEVTRTPKVIGIGVVDDYAYTLCDDIYFRDFNPRKVGQVIHFQKAGLTHPDARYICCRSVDHPYAPYLYVMEYVTSGKGHIECGKKKYEVHAGDFYLLNRGSNAIVQSDAKDPFQKKYIHICGRFINSLCYTYGINEPVLIVQADAEEQIDHIHKILEKYDFQNSEEADLQLMHALLDLFALIHVTKKTPVPQRDSVVFDQILEYISANITFDRITPSFISSYFYISYRTLNRMFVKNLGILPTKYITMQKIEYAKQLLLTTGNSVERISKILNFSNVEYFRKLFKAYTGDSPTKWKKANRTT